MRALVLIVDDHPLVAEALRDAIMRAYPQLDGIIAQSAAEAEALIRQHSARIRLVLLDLILPDASGFSAFLRVQQMLPERPIAVISSRADFHTVGLARAFGCAAYLRKTDPLRELVGAVGEVLKGERLFPPDTGEDTAQGAKSLHANLAKLSPAQLRVTLALVDGRLNKEIAAEMGLTEGTVKQHLSAVFKKLGVNNRTQAILAVRPYVTEVSGSPDR